MSGTASEILPLLLASVISEVDAVWNCGNSSVRLELSAGEQGNPARGKWATQDGNPAREQGIEARFS